MKEVRNGMVANRNFVPKLNISEKKDPCSLLQELGCLYLHESAFLFSAAMGGSAL